LDSPTDYRKIPRPSKNVYFFPLNQSSRAHADKWFEYFGGLPPSSARPAEIALWGRKLAVPSALGSCARFTFHDLCGLPLGSADYVELCRRYRAFVVTDVPKMSFREKDLARRFIVFIDAVYESKAKIVLTSEAPIGEIFSGQDPIKLGEKEGEHGLDSGMRSLMDDLGISMDVLLESSIFVQTTPFFYTNLGRLGKRKDLLLRGRCRDLCRWVVKSGLSRESIVLRMHNSSDIRNTHKGGQYHGGNIVGGIFIRCKRNVGYFGGKQFRNFYTCFI